MTDTATSAIAVVKTRRGWAVQFEDGNRSEDTTRRAAGAHLQRVLDQRAELAAHTAAAEARDTARLAARGIGRIDFRQLRPGDLFTWQASTPIGTVTRVEHYDSGGSLIFLDPSGITSCGCILMTPGYQGYGRLQRPRS